MEKSKRITKIGMLVSLSVILSIVIRVPGTSMSLDSFPGYFAAIILSPFDGGIVGFLGHLATAFNSGFPLGILTHTIIAIEMFIAVFLFGYITKKVNTFIAVLVSTIINGALCPLSLVPLYGMGFFLAIVMPLTIVSFLNIMLAVMLDKGLKNPNQKGVIATLMKKQN
ncbi:alpha-ribazole transporter [Alkalithermobacter thermoalcaliphilus JW-YL-7 = DSM 7308]|uniref:Alpha-ribazole transporter n=1 Tax=Alkalithermobacter thermoalcaliphilus JW-YL-7 = DSM 7308 TaxID=1121328 RepID=A0A150FND7_CLOPD|nr:ECF transporter, substrate-specific component [[Clostridium] paradoxum JW-YL-7 = DSM 7308]SHK91298.1 alpha-ribazole transporter [[Clostridium] paradoxum JW-YL-7 = DSM 7308]